jgi:hypothetical protein
METIKKQKRKTLFTDASLNVLKVNTTWRGAVDLHNFVALVCYLIFTLVRYYAVLKT